MWACIRNCFSGIRGYSEPTISSTSDVNEAKERASAPPAQAQSFVQDVFDGLLCTSAGNWRERIGGFLAAFRCQASASLYIYSTDLLHAVAVHSAGPLACRVPPGSVELVDYGGSHAGLLNTTKPLSYTPLKPLDPMPHDWRSLAACESVHSLALLPLQQAGAVYGSVLLCIHDDEVPSGSVGAQPASKAALGEEQLAQLAQYLSLGLFNNPMDLAVLRKVADAAVAIRGAMTLQDAVVALVESVQTCLRLITRLDLECIPAVAFRSAQIAVLMRSAALPYLPAVLDGDLPAPLGASPLRPPSPHDQGAHPHQHPQHHCQSRHRQPNPHQQLHGVFDLHGPALPSGARALATKRLGDDARPSTRSASGSILAPNIATHDARQHDPQAQQQLLQQQHGASQQQPRSSPSVPASRGSVAHLEVSEHSLAALRLSGALRIRASTVSLHQTLLGRHLDQAAAAAAAAEAADGAAAGGGADGASRGAAPLPAAALLHNGSLESSRGGSMGRSGAGSNSGARAMASVRSPDGAAGAAGGVGGSGGAAGPAAPPQRCSGGGGGGVAVVPNCATFLMLDERLPYKDILHVQRLLPQARAHSLVMVLCGRLSGERRGSGDVSGTHHSDALDGDNSKRHPAASPYNGDFYGRYNQHQQQHHQPQHHALSRDCGPAGALEPHCASSNAGFLILPCNQEDVLGLSSAAVARCAVATACPPGSLPATPAAALALAGAPPPSAAAAAVAVSLSRGRERGSLVEMVSLRSAELQALHGGSLALYLVASESVPRAILEQVAEEARQLAQMLHTPFTAALTSETLAPEWYRFASMVLVKSPNAAVAAAAAASAAASAAAAASGPASAACSMSGHSAPPPSLLFSSSALPASGSVQKQPYERMGTAVAPSDVVLITPHANSSSLRMYTQTPTQLSCETDDLTGGGLSVSVVLDTSTPANTGTLSLMISSMRDALSTLQLERCPDYRSTAADDVYAVRLLKLIGRGGQGMVFRGLLHNTTVAVKVIPTAEDPEEAAAAAAASGAEPAGSAGGAGAGGRQAGPPDAPPGAPGADEAERRAAQAAAKLQQRHKRWLVRDALEVAVTSTISHPHIVQVLNFFTDALVVEHPTEGGRCRLLPRQDNPTAKGNSNTVIVMEYCDAGTLRRAVETGCFRAVQGGDPTSPASGDGNGAGTASSSSTGGLSLVPLLTTLLEVASGLRHLHEHRLVHCDVKPSNVLLRSCASDPRGWTSKLSDFGCVRLLTDTDAATGRPVFHALSPVGSISYMAPETMARDAVLDASIDVYSFGILMWECASAAPGPYPGVPSQQLPGLVKRGLRPSFHSRVPAEYRQIASMCWAHDPRRRPSSASLVQMLQRMLTHALSDSPTALSRSHSRDTGGHPPLQAQTRPPHQAPQGPQAAHPTHTLTPGRSHALGELAALQRGKTRMPPPRAASQGPPQHRAAAAHSLFQEQHSIGGGGAAATAAAGGGGSGGSGGNGVASYGVRPPQLSMSRLGAGGPGGSRRELPCAVAERAAGGGEGRRATGGGMLEGGSPAAQADTARLRPRLISCGNVVHLQSPERVVG